jgi:prevent-host-death family protein
MRGWGFELSDRREIWLKIIRNSVEMEAEVATIQVNLYEAKTQLSGLVDRAAGGEEIIIAKAGKPLARLMPLAVPEKSAEPESLPFGQNLLGITFLSDDWEEDLPPEMFEDPEGDKLLFSGLNK